jgi:hypothetical protein
MGGKGYWKDENNQREALERVGKRLGVKELDDWYRVSSLELSNSKLSFMLPFYNNSIYKALKKLYPQHEWNPLKFMHVPKGVWKVKKVQKDALERFGSERGVKTLDDWYSVSSRDATKELSFITKYYKGSLALALSQIYPQHQWDLSRFVKTPQGYWRDEEVQRKALEKAAEELGVKELDDWYKVTSMDVARKKLWFILMYHNNSRYQALKTLYPQHDWDPLRFRTTPKGHFKTIHAQKDALERLARQFGVKRLDDWYSVPSMDVKRELSFIVKYYDGSFFNVLSRLYPHHIWDEKKLARSSKKDFWSIKRLQFYSQSVLHVRMNS